MTRRQLGRFALGLAVVTVALTAGGFVGHRWSGLCVYSPEWVSCTATLTTFYRHD